MVLQMALFIMMVLKKRDQYKILGCENRQVRIEYLGTFSSIVDYE